ncbi:MAG: hypothetical protein ABR582_10360 [Gemmatimonadaceae bacterium]
MEATVGPSGATVVTPSGAAGVVIPAGTFSQQVTVSVTQLQTPSTPGTGPLPTNLKQYGPYYDFTTSPQVAQFGDSARVGVCQVTDPSSPLYPPEPHDRLRLAHTVNGQLELLDRVDVTDFLHCTNVSASTATGGLSKIVSNIANFFRAQPLYAAHGGLGGKVKSFSPFGAVFDACADTTALTVGITASGTIERTDCEMLNVAAVAVSGDIFKFSLANQSTLRVATTGGTELQLRTELITNPASQENLVSEVSIPESNYLILPAGNYAMAIHNRSTANATDRIPYTLTMQSVVSVSGCPINQNQQTNIFPGIVLDASVATDDCPTTVQGLFGDNYWIQMVPSRTYQFSTTANIGIRLELALCCNSTIPVRFASGGPGTVNLSFQPPSAGLYVLDVIGNTSPAPAGPYRLSVTKQ